LLSELDVPQGTGGCVFINPLPIVSGLGQLREETAIQILPQEYFTSYWQSRYSGLDNMKEWASFPAALSAEREAIETCLAEIRRGLLLQGYSTRDDAENLGSVFSRFFGDIALLTQALKETKQLVPHPAFERLFRDDPVPSAERLDNRNGEGIPRAGANRRATISAAVTAAETVVSS